MSMTPLKATRDINISAKLHYPLPDLVPIPTFMALEPIKHRGYSTDYSLASHHYK